MAAAQRRLLKESHLHQIPAKGSHMSSDPLPLPLYFANAVVLPLFIAAICYLLLQWREKIRNSTPLNILSHSEISAILIFFASFIYLLSFIDVGQLVKSHMKYNRSIKDVTNIST